LRISQMGLSEPEDDSALVLQQSKDLPDSPPSQLSERSEGLFPTPLTRQPQLIDQDVEDFTTKLDMLVAQFRNESVREFLTMKRSILHEQISTIDGERKRCNAQLGLKQDELEHMKEELARTTTLKNAYDSQRWALAGLVGKGKVQGLGVKCKANAFSGWVKYHLNCRQKAKIGKIVKILGEKSVSRRTFWAWKGYWSEYHSEKQREKLDFLIQEERKSLSIQYGKEIQMLQERLAAANLELDQEGRNKVLIQENLKKAFMRGVCALNFEAMNILQPGPGGDVTGGAQDYMAGVESIVGAAFQDVSTRPPDAEPRTLESASIDEGQNIPPAESKEDKWKPAPIYGSRPQTAPPAKEAYPTHLVDSELDSVPDSEVTLASLPSNLNKAPGQGKTIVVGRNLEAEVKLKGKAPVAVKSKKAGSKK